MKKIKEFNYFENKKLKLGMRSILKGGQNPVNSSPTAGSSVVVGGGVTESFDSDWEKNGGIGWDSCDHTFREVSS